MMTEMLPHLVKITANNMYVTGKCFQVINGLLRAEISRAENVLDLARNKQLAKLSRNRTCTMRNMKISNN